MSQPVYTIMEAAFMNKARLPFKVKPIQRENGSELVLAGGLPKGSTLTVTKIHDINQFNVEECEQRMMGGQERIWTLVH